MFDGHFSIFFQRPISLGFLLLTIIIVLTIVINTYRTAMKKTDQH